MRTKKTVRRATHKGCLSLGLDEYLKLLDWTGRQNRAISINSARRVFAKA